MSQNEPLPNMNESLPNIYETLDRTFIKDLLVRGIIGINPEERVNKQDILINATLWADTRRAGETDNVEFAVNYRTAAKAIIAHIEENQPLLVERLVADLVRICMATNDAIQAIEMTVEKPGAVRFAQSVGVTIFRTRTEVMGDST